MSDNTLIQALQNPTLYDHPITRFQVIETHISWVILTGFYAYKIKKPANLGFLDFSNLEKRHYYCQQEVLLNKRLAPDIYLSIVAIGGRPDAPSFNINPIIEYAVKMRQFSQSARLDIILNRNELEAEHIDQLADQIAQFHSKAEIASNNNPYGEPTTVFEPIDKNFQQISPFLSEKKDIQQLDRLEKWSMRQYEQLQPIIKKRKLEGFVRNCHGDMHLSNIALLDGEITVFDCIEFNESLRWIDVMSEVAFITMDLIDRNKPTFAAHLLDRYLQRSGDYSGLALLKFYQVYRALVRAKVAIIQASDTTATLTDKQHTIKLYKEYTDLAETFTHAPPVTLFITHGVSGSGKTTLTQPLLEKWNLIRIRSDIERKRLFGMQAEDHTDTAIYHKVYGEDAHQHTYHHLLTTTKQICQSGFSVIVDATFLKQTQRQQFQNLARELNILFVILDFHADKQCCNDRIKLRTNTKSDASEATSEVLQHQLSTEEPLTEHEADHIIHIDSSTGNTSEQLLDAHNALSLHLNH
ncbi:MAG: AAA family ATPase [Nitrosomonas sp.]|nr:AAA family ATPase [Nitrosomonas sp.]